MGKEKEPTVLVSEITAMFCFTAMLWKTQYSIPARLLFPQRGSKEKQHNCNPPWDAQLEKVKEWTTFTTNQTTRTQFKKETDRITYWKEEIRPAN